jgi:Uma2 family endonuclease
MATTTRRLTYDDFTYLLNQHVRPQRLGKIYAAPIDVRLTPDIVFLSQERRHLVGPKTVDAAPDLVVEILSPGTRQRDLGVKRDLYARFGVQEYWIVDPDERSLTILSLRGDRFQFMPTGKDEKLISRLLPDLMIDLAETFP